MERVMRLVFVAAIAAAVGLPVASAGATPRASSSTIATFSDSVGEIAGAPDIGTVTVSLDGDVLTIDAQVAAMPELLSEGGSMFALNTDGNASTGELLGADYVVITDFETLEGSVVRWNGTEYVKADKIADPARTILGAGHVGILMNLANFGSPKHVEFALIVSKGSIEGGLYDLAPDAGRWAFEAVAPVTQPPPVVKPVFGIATTVPATPAAGKKLVFTLAVNRSDTGAPLATGRMICDPSVAGVVIKHAESFTGGTAKLTFTVPKTAKGKLLKVKVTIVNGGRSATKVVSIRVR